MVHVRSGFVSWALMCFGFYFDFTYAEEESARFTFYVVVMTDFMATFVLVFTTFLANMISDLSCAFVGMEHELGKFLRLSLYLMRKNADFCIFSKSTG